MLDTPSEYATRQEQHGLDQLQFAAKLLSFVLLAFVVVFALACTATKPTSWAPAQPHLETAAPLALADTLRHE